MYVIGTPFPTYVFETKVSFSYLADKENEIQHGSICCFTPQITTIARAEPAQNQKPESHPDLSYGWLDPKHLAHFSIDFQAHLHGESRAAKA